MKCLKITMVLFCVLLMANKSMAQEKWSYPLIKGYGGIKYFSNAAEQPLKNKDYKIVFDVKSDKEKNGVNAGLWHIARELNLLTAGGVKSKNRHIVAVIHGPATSIVLNNTAYNRVNKKDNPNRNLIYELKKHGVDIFLCGQAAAENNINVNTDLDSNVTLSLSALILIPNYQYKDYALIP